MSTEVNIDYNSLTSGEIGHDILTKWPHQPDFEFYKWQPWHAHGYCSIYNHFISEAKSVNQQ